MTIMEAMDAAGAFTGDAQWYGLDFQTLASALTSKNTGIGIDQYKQAYVSNGDPNGNVYVANEENALCFDTRNRVVWFKRDGAISSHGWSTGFAGSQSDPSFQIIPGDPADWEGHLYDIHVTSTGLGGTQLDWIYPVSQPIQPTTTNKIYLQRSPTLTTHPLGDDTWFKILVLPADTGAPADGDWQTIVTWIQPAVGWADPTLPNSYFDSAVPDHIYNYRLVMFVGGGPGGTFIEVDWNVTSAIKHYVFTQIGSCPGDPTHVCLAWQ